MYAKAIHSVIIIGTQWQNRQLGEASHTDLPFYKTQAAKITQQNLLFCYDVVKFCSVSSLSSCLQTLIFVGWMLLKSLHSQCLAFLYMFVARKAFKFGKKSRTFINVMMSALSSLLFHVNSCIINMVLQVVPSEHECKNMEILFGRIYIMRIYYLFPHFPNKIVENTDILLILLYLWEWLLLLLIGT